MTSAPADASAVKGSRWKGAMGRLPLVVGAAMLLADTRLSKRFVVETGDIRPEVAGLGQTESMLIGALLACVGPLLLILGLTGKICKRLGIGW